MGDVVRAFIAAVGFSLAAVGPASAGLYCTAPLAPSFDGNKPQAPTVPFCVDKIMKTHTCDEFTIGRYNNDITEYNNALQTYSNSTSQYIDELNEYLKKAKLYAQCEVDSL
jgi:hypothetical protein